MMKTVKVKPKRNTLAAIGDKAAYPIVFLLSFFVSDAAVLNMSPFGVSVTAAVPYKLSLISFFGSIAGYILLGGGLISNIHYTVALIAVIAVKFFLSGSKRPDRHKVLVSVTAAIAVFGAGLINVFSFDLSFMNIFRKISEGILCGAMSYFCAAAYNLVSKRKSVSDMSSAELTSLLAAVSLLLLPMFGMDIAIVNLGRIAGGLLILVILKANGISGGMCFAAITSICTAVYDPELITASGIIMISAFFAGAVIPLGKFAMAAIYVVSATAFTFVAGAEIKLLYAAIDMMISAVLFTVIPPSLYDIVKSQTKIKRSGGYANRTVAAKLNLASETIGDLKNSVKRVSKKLEQANIQDISTVYSKTADMVCRRCGFKMYCWDTAYNDTMRAFNSITPKLRTHGRIAQSDLPDYFMSKCCKPASLCDGINKNYREYVQKERGRRHSGQSRDVAVEQFDGIAKMLCEIAGELADVSKYDEMSAVKIRRALKGFSLFPKEVCCYQDRFGRMTAEIYFDEKPKNFKTEMITERLSEVLGYEFDLPSITVSESSTRISFFEKADYSIDFYASQLPVGDEKISGDAYEFFIDSKGFVYIVLSDGMGNGKRAAVDSVMTSSLVLKLLKSGFGPESALRLINASMIVKSDDESLATLDILKLDMYLGRAEFFKAGAASSFVLHGDSTIKVESGSLPIGILENITFDKTELTVKNADIIVMVSDGVLSEGEEWVESVIELNRDKNAHQISELLLAEAKRRVTNHADDMTVLTIKLNKNI